MIYDTFTRAKNRKSYADTNNFTHTDWWDVESESQSVSHYNFTTFKWPLTTFSLFFPIVSVLIIRSTSPVRNIATYSVSCTVSSLSLLCLPSIPIAPSIANAIYTPSSSSVYIMVLIFGWNFHTPFPLDDVNKSQPSYFTIVAKKSIDLSINHPALSPISSWWIAVVAHLPWNSANFILEMRKKDHFL